MNCIEDLIGNDANKEDGVVNLNDPHSAQRFKTMHLRTEVANPASGKSLEGENMGA